jgi:Cytochrome P450
VVKATQVTGLAAGREYLRFFFDPVGTICRVYRRYGRVKFKQPRDLLLFAIGPEFNRLLFSDPNLFRPTGLILPGPRNSAQRRVRFGLTRICIGGAFAAQVLKISLAMILQRFRFTVVPGTRINRIVAISMNPRHGLPMMIAKKDRNYSVSEVRGQIREMVDFPANGAA